MIPSIYLSPSTQEHNIGYGNYGSELMRMNQITDVIAKHLDASGLLYYRNNSNWTLDQVINDSNQKKPDIHFSIHSNAGGGSGALCLIYDWNGEREKFAKIIYEKLSAITPMKDNGIRLAPKLAELRRTTAPACLIEVAFHDRKEDAQWIMDNIDLIGRELAKGICQYFDVKFISASDQLFRVRKTWSDSKSQLGAFRVLENAKKLVDSNPEYSVFDEKGNILYPSNFLVKVTADGLNIRKGPGTNYSVVGVIRDKGTYTIVETSGNWGKLKSGAGWIHLNYTATPS